MVEDFSGGDTFGSLFRKNRRLSRELARIESVFNAINSAIVVVDGRGVINFANAFAKRIFGLKDAGESLYKYAPMLEEGVCSVAETNLDARREFDVAYPEKKSLVARIIPFTFDDTASFAVIINDITQEKISKLEQIESEKISSVLNLASGVAHELGNPLNSINIHLQLVRRRLAKLADKIGDAQALGQISESVEICASEVSRLNGIIENFLKALRPMRPNVSECDPIKPLAETLKILNEQLLNLKISVDVDSENALPAVCADENLLKQLYFNIIKNAIESMEEGGSIKIKATSDDDFVKISFADSGCGMTEDELSKIFEPYFTTKPNGHGLGMMIINAIVRAHGGHIDIKSRRGEGTTIDVSIPRNERRVKLLS